MLLTQFIVTIVALAVYDLFVKLPVSAAWEKFKNRSKG